jgi:hypothetical protein
MSAEHFCKASILLLSIIAVSTVPIAGAFKPIAVRVHVPQLPMTRMSLTFGTCGSLEIPTTQMPQASALHLAMSDASSSSGGDSSDAVSESSLGRPKRGIFSPLRATLRGITGFSLTALRASLRAATGISITSTTKALVGLFPLWFRYFMQPFLVLYYAPLMMMRSWVGETKTSKAEQMAAHEKLVEGWKHAVEVAEAAQANEYWPVHVDADGNIVASMPPQPEDVWTQSPLNEAVLESVEVADAIENE